MTRSLGPRRALLLAIGLVALVAALTLPVLAASPAPSGAPAASEHPGKGPKASKEPEVAVTLRGVVVATKDANGTTSFSMTVNGRTVQLEAGPPWFWGDKNPLAAFVGKTVTITGDQRGDEVDVDAVDGTALREPGRPPWAGGWKAVGSAHPGWSKDKADRWQQKQSGNGAGPFGAGCWPPGHCKDQAPQTSSVPRGD